MSTRTSWLRGLVAMMPLNLAVLPWGVLAGSYAIDSGFSAWQAQAMSVFVFAGSAQIVATGMMAAGSGLVVLLLTVALITARHLLYGLTLRQQLQPLPARWRYSLGFLLTDELFVLSANKTPFDRHYALSAGLSFYLCWNLSTALGIVAGQSISNLDELGLDFAVASTFIALSIPAIRTSASFATVVVALVLSVALTYWQLPAALLISVLIAMAAGYLVQKTRGTQSQAEAHG